MVGHRGQRSLAPPWGHCAPWLLRDCLGGDQTGDGRVWMRMDSYQDWGRDSGYGVGVWARHTDWNGDRARYKDVDRDKGLG